VLDTLALALAADKQVPAALDVQRRAVELAPEAKQLRLNYAKLAVQAGDKALARQELLQLQTLGAAFPGQAEVTRLLQGL
jgi:predicted Zn-dependent protease